MTDGTAAGGSCPESRNGRPNGPKAHPLCAQASRPIVSNGAVLLLFPQ
jgi:hypothetical protein